MSVKSEILRDPIFLNPKENKGLFLISYNDADPVMRIGRLTSDGEPRQGISLEIEEARVLRNALNNLDLEDFFDESEEDATKGVDLYSCLTDVKEIDKARKKGYITEDGRIVIKRKR